MKRTYTAATWTVAALLSVGCGGAKKEPKVEEPPPPIDENLLDLVPYETDLVLWVDFAKLRSAPVWGLVDKVLKGGALQLPEEEAINPALSCDEAVLAFMDSEQFGNQLLIITKGNEISQTQAADAVRAKEGAIQENAEGFNGIRTKQVLLLSLTPQTLMFGNDTVVRMGAKAGLKKGRSLRENPDFAAFKTGGDVAARMYYRAGLNTQNVQQFKKVVPRINADAISVIEGTLNADEGVHILANIDMQTQMDASVFAQEAGRTLDQLKGNMIVLFLGLDWLRDKIVLTSDKSRVTVDIRLDARDVENLNQLAERLKKIQELLGGMDDAQQP